MIEVNLPQENNMEKSTKPAQITVSMIIDDLENGIDRPAIQAKYQLEAWEVKQMFIHPALKGKKAKKIRKLSFLFVDDTEATTTDPAQIDLEASIEELQAEGQVKYVDESQDPGQHMDAESGGLTEPETVNEEWTEDGKDDGTEEEFKGDDEFEEIV
jgi:hypothetical protein